MSETELFPETTPTQSVVKFKQFDGIELKEHGAPRVQVELLMSWNPVQSWVCGWHILIDRSGDEWNPLVPDAYKSHSYYPWYRPAEMPHGKNQMLVAIEALRAARIVVEQMIHYMTDEVGREDARTVSNQMEKQIRDWLGL